MPRLRAWETKEVQTRIRVSTNKKGESYYEGNQSNHSAGIKL